MHIVFDFTKVDFMDSAGIGLIMGRYKRVMDKGDITIVGVRESVKRILLISGLHKIVNIYELKRTGGISMIENNNVELLFEARSENEAFARVVAAAFVTYLDQQSKNCRT